MDESAGRAGSRLQNELVSTGGQVRACVMTAPCSAGPCLTGTSIGRLRNVVEGRNSLREPPNDPDP